MRRERKGRRMLWVFWVGSASPSSSAAGGKLSVFSLLVKANLSENRESRLGDEEILSQLTWLSPFISRMRRCLTDKLQICPRSEHYAWPGMRRRRIPSLGHYTSCLDTQRFKRRYGRRSGRRVRMRLREGTPSSLCRIWILWSIFLRWRRWRHSVSSQLTCFICPLCLH